MNVLQIIRNYNIMSTETKVPHVVCKGHMKSM